MPSRANPAIQAWWTLRGRRRGLAAECRQKVPRPRLGSALGLLYDSVFAPCWQLAAVLGVCQRAVILTEIQKYVLMV
jgi:hypothetical protein